MTENSVCLPQSAIVGWTTRRLGDPHVSAITMGQSPESETYNVSGMGLPFFQGKADFGLRHPTPRTWCSAPTRVAEAGDILVSVRAPVGDANIARERCCIGRGIAALRPNPKVHGEFLFYSLMHRKSDLDALGSGAINKDTLHAFEIHIPPFPEQQAIASVLTNIQAAVEVQERIVAALKELKAATMAKLFRDGLRGEPLKQTEIGQIPESWEVKTCESVCREITVGIVVTPAKYYVPMGVPCLRSFNIREDRLVERDFVFISEAANELHAKSRLRGGDVVVVRTGYPGTACVIPENYDGANCVDLLIARPNDDLVLGDYLARFMNSPEGKRQVTLAQGGLAQQHFNVGALRKMAVAVPGKAEQAGISRIGKLLDSRILTAESTLTNAKAVFSAMLQALMRGRVRARMEVSSDRDSTAGVGQVESERFVAELVRRFKPERVILFGPPAAGSPRAFGEVGLLVEMEFEGLARDQAARMAHEIPHDFSLDLVVRRPEDVERAVEIGDAFINGVLERGRTLHLPAGGARSRREKAPREEKPPRQGHVSEETLGEIVQRIVEAVQPEKIILFGSAARGEMGPDSDVDLLVVRTCTDRRETARTIRQHLIGVAPGLPKDVIVVTPEEAERHKDTIGLIIRPALREGRVVYAA